jgi:hypothetical protein
MKDESIRKSLETTAQRNIPENTNLWPRLAARLERKDTVSMNLKWRLIWTILLVLLGLFALTGVAYAFYRYFNNDAGMQSVSNAGLLATVNATAQPTPNPTATPPEPVTVIGDSQTLEGTGLTLEWVYLMDGQQAFGFSADGLAGGKMLGMPEMGFGRLTPEQYRGAGMAMKDAAQPVTGTYVVNQIVRDDATFGKTDTRTDVSITIPLLDGKGQVLNTFRFAVKDELVHAGPFTGGNAYSTRANGQEMDLDWVLLGSKTVQARLCFPPPDGKDWRLVSPTIQLGADPNQLASATPVTASPAMPITDENGIRCQVVTFPVSTQGAQAFLLTAGELATSAGETLRGDWTFDWNQLPGQMQFPGISPLAASLGSNEIDSNTTVTLEKAYADVDRMVFIVFIKSSQESLLAASAMLKDANGVDLNTGLSITSPPDDPTRFIIEFDPSDAFAPGRFQGQLVVEIGTHFGLGSGLPGAPFASGGGGGGGGGGAGGSGSAGATAPTGQAEVHFPVDLTVYPAVTVNLMQTDMANGVTMLLQKVEVTPSYSQIYLCYQKPSSADWNLGQATSVQIGSDSSMQGTSTLLFDPDFNPPAPEGWSSPITTGRCEKVGFQVGHHNQPETLTLTIPQLEESVPDVIPNDQLQAARKKLLAQGIEIDWVTSTGNGGGGAGLEINQKPAGMTDDEAARLFWEALGYYHPGPWTFTVTINP